MCKYFLIAAIFINLLQAELFAQRTPLDRCVRDSLFRVKPNESQVEKALIYMQLAEIIRDRLPQKSFSYIVSAFKIAISENNDSLKARARMQMAEYYVIRHQYMKAHEQYLAAWKTSQASKDTAGQEKALLKIGNLNRYLNNYKVALTYLQRGIDLYKNKNAPSIMGKFFAEIGLVYQAMGDRETAMNFFNRSLFLFRSVGDTKNKFEVQNCIGGVLLNEEKYDEGLAFYKKLLYEANTCDHESMGILYTRIGHIYCKKNDHRNSLNYNMLALNVRQRLKAIFQISSSLINIAGDYYDLGKPDSGKLYMDSGLVIARRLNAINLIENGYRHLYTYNLHKRNYKEALNYYAQYISEKEELSRERTLNNIAIIETNQRLQQLLQSGKMFARQHNIQSLNLKYHIYQLVFLIVLMGLTGFSMLIFILLLLYVRRARHAKQELNVQLSDEIKVGEATNRQTLDRESQYKFLTDNSGDLITHMDSKKNRTYASPASMSVMGYEPEEFLPKTAGELTSPDFQTCPETNFQEMIETRSSRQFSYKAKKKDGTVFWAESIINPLFDPISGDFKGMVSVTRDIQERKTKEFEIMEGTRQKENLLKEIHHRVKNNFAILVSLINMQMAQTKNQELLQSLTNLQLRIRTMALVHEMLYRSSDFEKISFPGYLRSLASVIAGTYNRRDIELTVEADEVVMDIGASIPLGLIVNEILSNSYKHAFPDGRAGKITIRYKMDPGGNNTLMLQDDGIGLPEEVNPDRFKTMGLQVVQILCNQIEAALVIANDPGATFTLTYHT